LNGLSPFQFLLFPLTHAELGRAFQLQSALEWGTLPSLLDITSDADRARYLRTYVQMYLKEEILVEQLIRKLDPFRLFLPVAAQMSGEPVNASNIARDTGVDYKTIQSYYQILVDTHLGFFLEPYGGSVREVQKKSPKFYFFDYGVKRALGNELRVPLIERTPEYGRAFETWLINECFRLNAYHELDFRFSYLRTKDDAEIDLIIERPGQKLALVEIKSARQVDDRHLKHISSFARDFPKADLIVASRVDRAQKHGRIAILPWMQALRELGC